MIHREGHSLCRRRECELHGAELFPFILQSRDELHHFGTVLLDDETDIFLSCTSSVQAESEFIFPSCYEER